MDLLAPPQAAMASDRASEGASARASGGRPGASQALAARLHAWFAPDMVVLAGPGAGTLAEALRLSGMATRVVSVPAGQHPDPNPHPHPDPNPHLDPNPDLDADANPDAAGEAGPRALGVLLTQAAAPAAGDAALARLLAARAPRVLLLPSDAAEVPPGASPADPWLADPWLDCLAQAGLQPDPGFDASAAAPCAVLAERRPPVPGDGEGRAALARLLALRARLAEADAAAERLWHRGRVARARMLTAEAAASRMFRQLAEANWQHSKVITMLREEGIATMEDTVAAQLGGRARGMIEQLARKQERAALELVRLNERNEWHEADLARLRHHLDNLPLRVAVGKLLAAGLRRLPGPAERVLAKGLQLAWWTATMRLGTKLAEREERRRLAGIVRASPQFDAAWYVAQHPELAVSGSDPALHYLLSGVTNRFDPGPGFGTHEYLRDHPEVEAAGTNPLVHLATLSPPATPPAARPPSATPPPATP